MREFMKIINEAQRKITHLYHMSPAENHEQIMQHGLDPQRSQSSLKAVFLAIDEFTAENYAGMHRTDSYNVYAVDVSALDPALLGPDNYELPDLLSQRNSRKSWDECSWRESLKICGQCAYHGVIPPSALTVV